MSQYPFASSQDNPILTPNKPAFCRKCGDLEQVTYDIGDDRPLGVRALCPQCGAGVHVRNPATGNSNGPLFLNRSSLGFSPRIGYYK